MADTNAAFIAWLRTTRKEAGLSQQKIADALQDDGFSVFRQTTIAKIERGARPVLLAEAVAIAALFGATLDVALGVRPGDPRPARQLAARTSLLTQIRAVIDAELGGAQ